MKNASILILALLSVCFSLLCVAFIFFAGLNKFVPETLINNFDIRNLFISIVHSFAALFAILYASFYIDRQKYDGKIVSPAITTVIMFIVTLFLGWRCYLSDDLDILVLIITIDGVIMSMFLLFLSILQYDVISPKTSRKYVPSLISKILEITAMVLFLFSIFTYYDYFSYLTAAIFHSVMTIFQKDALVLYTFMLANICLMVAIIMMFFIEHKLNQMLKEFTAKVKSKTKE